MLDEPPLIVTMTPPCSDMARIILAGHRDALLPPTNGFASDNEFARSRL